MSNTLATEPQLVLTVSQGKYAIVTVVTPTPLWLTDWPAIHTTYTTRYNCHHHLMMSQCSQPLHRPRVHSWMNHFTDYLTHGHCFPTPIIPIHRASCCPLATTKLYHIISDRCPHTICQWSIIVTSQHTISSRTVSAYRNRGTTFQMTENKDSGEMAVLPPCQTAIRVLRSSSTSSL